MDAKWIAIEVCYKQEKAVYDRINRLTSYYGWDFILDVEYFPVGVISLSNDVLCKKSSYVTIPGYVFVKLPLNQCTVGYDNKKYENRNMNAAAYNKLKEIYGVKTIHDSILINDEELQMLKSKASVYFAVEADNIDLQEDIFEKLTQINIEIRNKNTEIFNAVLEKKTVLFQKKFFQEAIRSFYPHTPSLYFTPGTLRSILIDWLKNYIGFLGSTNPSPDPGILKKLLPSRSFQLEQIVFGV